jgi:hypothetical protein
MQKIPINLAAAGMVLAKDVKADDNPSSSPICGKGLTLTASLISRLSSMGIQSLNVEGHPVKIEGEMSLDEALAALEKRFSKVADDALMLRLKEIYRRQIVRSMGDNNG